MFGTLLFLLLIAAAPADAGPDLAEHHANTTTTQTVAGARAPMTPEDVFLEAWTVVHKRFFDPGMCGVDWPSVRDELLPRARAADSPAALSGVINDALRRLGASHTAHYHPGQREFYELGDVFAPDAPAESGTTVYTGIGLAARVIDGAVFAADVYPDGPAHAAGVLVGDELVGVEGGPWSDVSAFAGRAGQPTRLHLRRERGGPVLTLPVTPEQIRPKSLFLRAMGAGARVDEHAGARILTVPVRSYASPDYQRLLEMLVLVPLLEGDAPNDDQANDAPAADDDILREALARAAPVRSALTHTPPDALILDLRGGWGGADTSYLRLFNPLVPRLKSTPRPGEVPYAPHPSAWTGPLVVLIDSGSRSGKEVLAYALRKHERAVLVGERTAGAVLAGTPVRLGDGSLLYLAVADARVDGVRLEGVGVEPHVSLPRPIPYCAGHDPQWEAALEEAADLIKRGR